MAQLILSTAKTSEGTWQKMTTVLGYATILFTIIRALGCLKMKEFSQNILL